MAGHRPNRRNFFPPLENSALFEKCFIAEKGLKREKEREFSPPSCRVTFSDRRQASLNTLQQVVFKFLEFNKPTPSRNGSRSSPAFVSPLFASWILVGPWIHDGEGFKVILTGKLVISELGWRRGGIHYHDSSLWVTIRLLFVWLYEVETYRDTYCRMHVTRRCTRNIQTKYLLRYLKRERNDSFPTMFILRSKSYEFAYNLHVESNMEGAT